MSGIRDKVATLVRRTKASRRKSEPEEREANDDEVQQLEPQFGVVKDERKLKLRPKPAKQIRKSAAEVNEEMGMSRSKPRASLFSNIFRKTKRKPGDGRKELLNPALHEESNGAYELRLSDLGYLEMPNTIYTFDFRCELNPITLREGLEKAIRIFPIVAGRLKVQKSHLKFGTEEEELFRIQDNNSRNIRTIERAGNEQSKLRLFAVLDPSISGVLFQTENLTEKEWVMRSRGNFFPLPAKQNKTDDPLLKVKLSTSPTKSILSIEVAAILADLPAMSDFISSWSEHCTPNNQSFSEKPSLNRVFEMSTEQYFDLNDSSLGAMPKPREQVKNIWKNPALKSDSPFFFNFSVTVDFVEALKASLSEKQKIESPDPEQLSDDEDDFFQLEDMSDLLHISSYEVLVAIAFKVYSYFYNVSEGHFCLNKRGRVPSTKINYFGVGNSFAKFAADNKLNIEDMTGLVASAYGKSLKNKKLLDSLDIMYESLYKDISPLRGNKKLKYDFKHEAPLAKVLEGSSPIFIGAPDLDKEFIDMDFGHPDALHCFDFEYRSPKLTTRIVRLTRYTTELFKISIALQRGLTESTSKSLKQKFSFISQI